MESADFLDFLGAIVTLQVCLCVIGILLMGLCAPVEVKNKKLSGRDVVLEGIFFFFWGVWAGGGGSVPSESDGVAVRCGL